MSTPAEPDLNLLTRKVSETYGVNGRDLFVRALLHLPRFTDSQLMVGSIVEKEISRLADGLRELRAGYEHLEHYSGMAGFGNAVVEEADEDLARIILERFHYIGRFRKNSTHIGVFVYEKGLKRIAGLTTVSEFDLNQVANYLPEDLGKGSVRILSRIYSFDWVPKNFGSYMLGRAFEFIRSNQPETKLLLTYLNPNLGFKGTIYRASNWSMFAKERISSYAYLDNNYTTLRALMEDFGPANLDSLKARLGKRLSYSLQPLKPLEIYRHFLDARLVKSHRGERVHSINKTPPIA